MKAQFLAVDIKLLCFIAAHYRHGAELQLCCSGDGQTLPFYLYLYFGTDLVQR